MFIKELKNNNQNLLESIKILHDKKLIEPDTYVIDIESVCDNAKLLHKKAIKNNLSLYQMTKQFGRNPYIANKIAKIGIDKVVAVDWREAEIMYKNGLKIGNIGHIVQVPTTKINTILDMKPEVWTIYTIENLKQLNAYCLDKKVTQDVILRVCDERTLFYPSQRGGIFLKEIKNIINHAKELKGINIVGVTAFPAMLMNEEGTSIAPTPNMAIITKAVKILKENGVDVKHINIPSANNFRSLDLIKKNNGTHGEPGHAFTGTTPINDNYKNDEKFDNVINIFGGGNYRRGHINGALIGNKFKFYENMKLPDDSIDYYFELKRKNNERIVPGELAILSFRTQIFVTRSKVAIIKGVSTLKPKIVGIFDSQGNES